MITSKKIFLMVILCMLLVLTIFSGCGGDSMRERNVENNASPLLDMDNLYNMTLTIHYIYTDILTSHPFSAECVIDLERYVIVVQGNELVEYADYLKKLNTDILIPAESEGNLHARLVYVFETEEDGRILMVAVGMNLCVQVNGVNYKSNDAFFDAIRPFMTEDALHVLRFFFG